VKELRRPVLVDEGFTLTELAVVMVIVALMVGGLLVPLSAQMEIRNINDNRKSMADIREALLGFAMVHGRLPCPARPDLASGTAGAGIESALGVGGGCDPQILAGVLPWATLGVDENDAWGRRYSYRVTSAFARSVPPPNGNVSGCPAGQPIPASAAFPLCADGDITVLSSKGGTPIASKIPAIVISHGRNGNGAHTLQGTPLPASADADELENEVVPSTSALWTDGPAEKTFVKRSVPTTGYDDEVVWIPPGVLFSRMITAGKLP
jgi:prepilin-type N-terminal cleavage/methylation domain-containing protein